jgi:putative Holliday junction resolvase
VPRVLALDYGSSRCGYAFSDPTGVLATPGGVVQAPASRAGLAQLSALVDRLAVKRVVVGLPVSLSGAESAQTREARAFATTLAKRLDVPVECYDERFTTKLAALHGGDAPEDARAAAHLLESWLEARAHEVTRG